VGRASLTVVFDRVHSDGQGRPFHLSKTTSEVSEGCFPSGTGVPDRKSSTQVIPDEQGRLPRPKSKQGQGRPTQVRTSFRNQNKSRIRDTIPGIALTAWLKTHTVWLETLKRVVGNPDSRGSKPASAWFITRTIFLKGCDFSLYAQNASVYYLLCLLKFFRSRTRDDERPQ
jgi:hypothetical protein